MKFKIISNNKITNKFSLCEVNAPDIARSARAGQFIMVSTHDKSLSYDPILNRPFAIADINGDNIFFLYMIVGRGTKRMLALKKDDNIEVVGALGNSFTIGKDIKTVAVLAGGIGIAPCILLGKTLKNAGVKATLYYGGRSEDDIVHKDILYSTYDDRVIPVTEDGSIGIKGLVTEPFLKDINQYDMIYACGPNRMLEAITKLAIQYDKPIEVSLDEHMGCGVGACLGCMISLHNKDKIIKKRCCVEGPIFDGKLVEWGSLCNR